VTAYVPGLPVYAVAETYAESERVIRAVLTEYLQAHPGHSTRRTGLRRTLLRPRKETIDIVGVAALLGGKRTAAKARASGANGGLGRPAKHPTRRTKASG